MNTTKLIKFVGFIVLMGIGLGFLAGPASIPLSRLVEAEQLDEISGIAASRVHQDILYAHNDSGDDPVVYVVNAKGQLTGSLLLKSVVNRDWEDIAVGPGPNKHTSYIYVGEIGDNRGSHKSVFVYRFPEPDSIRGEREISNVDKLEIVFSDGARDAEALCVDPRNKDIVIISKREEKVGVYRVKYPQSTTSVNVAEKVASLPLSWVTAADMSPQGDMILVKTYTQVYSYKIKKRDSLAKAFSRKSKILPYIIEPQGEAICFDAEGKGRFTLSERSGKNPLYLYHYKK